MKLDEPKVKNTMNHRGPSKTGLSKKNIVILIVFLTAIASAELVITYSSVTLGVLMYGIISFAVLITLLINLRSGFSDFSNLLMTLWFMPGIRIIGLSLPLMYIPALYWFPLIAVPLFIFSFLLIFIQKLNRKELGLVLGNIPLQLAIALSGILLGFIEFFILKPKPIIPSFTWEAVLIGSIILIISTGFVEELFFRGILQTNAEKVLGKFLGLLYVAVLFTAMHIGWNNFYNLIFVFCVAMFYGYAFQKTRSLLGITLSHGLSNTVLFLIMPFLFF